MADQMTPAEVAAERIVDDVASGGDMTTADAARCLASFTAIIAQATLDACEQAAPRVRAEERVAVLREVLALLDGNEDMRRSDDYDDVAEMKDDAVRALNAIGGKP